MTDDWKKPEGILPKILLQTNKLGTAVWVNYWIIMIISYDWNIQGLLNKFPDFFRMGTFIDSTNMKL